MHSAEAVQDPDWKIKNTGAEATRLRGNRVVRSVEDDGSCQRFEVDERYRGSHYVECYVVKDGRVVARDRQPVNVL